MPASEAGLGTPLGEYTDPRVGFRRQMLTASARTGALGSDPTWAHPGMQASLLGGGGWWLVVGGGVKVKALGKGFQARSVTNNSVTPGMSWTLW